MLYIFFHVDSINQWYLSNNEVSHRAIDFKLVGPNKFFQVYSREVWLRND